MIVHNIFMSLTDLATNAIPFRLKTNGELQIESYDLIKKYNQEGRSTPTLDVIKPTSRNSRWSQGKIYDNQTFQICYFSLP